MSNTIYYHKIKQMKLCMMLASASVIGMLPVSRRFIRLRIRNN